MMNQARMKQLAPLARKLLGLRAGEGRLIIYPHLNADGDAYGSALALTALLNKAGLKTLCLLNESPDPDYLFLPGCAEASVWPELTAAEKEQLAREQQAALMIDVSAEERLAERLPLYRAAPVHFVLDHHVSEQPNDEGHYIFPEAAASCELVTELALVLEKESGLHLLSAAEALCLYTGLLTDTGNFSYANVRPSTLAAAAELLACGIDLPALTDRLFRAISWTRYRLEGALRGRTRQAAGGRIAYLTVPRSLLTEYGAEDADVEAMPSLLRDIKGTKISLVLRETASGKLRGNLRSEAEVDVRRIAALFGGGGHVNAAGFTIEGESLEEALPKVLSCLEEALADGES